MPVPSIEGLRLGGMLLAAIAVLGGVGLLAYAPDRFVAGAAELADRWGVSRVVIGAVVIGFGTSAPEMVVSGLASGQGNPEVAIGNVIGSNIANLSLIVAVAALIGLLRVPGGLLRQEVPLMLGSTVLFAVVAWDGVSRIEGTVLLVVLVAVMWAIITGITPGGPDELELTQEVDGYLEARSRPFRMLAIKTVVGLVGTMAGAQLLVTGAISIADEVGLSGGFVGMTVVALGTSLPELVTAIAAVRADEDQMVLGNVLGSNIFNSLAVGGVIGWSSVSTAPEVTNIGGAILLMLAITAIAATVLIAKKTVERPEAVALLLAYAICIPILARF